MIQIVHRIGKRAERHVEAAYLNDLKRVAGKTRLLYRIADAALEHPDESVREVVFPVVTEQTLRDLVAEYKAQGSRACGVAFWKGVFHMFHLCNWNALNGVHVDLDPPFCSAGLQSLLSVYRSAGLAGLLHLTSEQTLLVMKALLAAWMLWASLVVVLALLLLVWQCWPALVRQSHCAWCWKRLGIMRWYPCRWSSTICCHHARQIRAQSAARRAAHYLPRQAEG